MPGRRESEEKRGEQILKAAYAVATRERLEGVTGRRVAEEAGLSSGLVFFHFENRDTLLLALLDWLLLGMRKDEEAALAEIKAPAEEMMFTVIEQRLRSLVRERQHVELFFDFWVMGTRNTAVRKRIREALDRYRDQLCTPAQWLITAHYERLREQSPLAIATVAVSFIEGCAIQAVIHPDRIDVPALVQTLRALVLSPSPASKASR